MEQWEQLDKAQKEAAYQATPWGMLIAPNREKVLDCLSSNNYAIVRSYYLKIREQLSKLLERPDIEFRETTFIRGQIVALDSVLGIKGRVEAELLKLTEEQKVKENG